MPTIGNRPDVNLTGPCHAAPPCQERKLATIAINYVHRDFLARGIINQELFTICLHRLNKYCCPSFFKARGRT